MTQKRTWLHSCSAPWPARRAWGFFLSIKRVPRNFYHLLCLHLLLLPWAKWPQERPTKGRKRRLGNTSIFSQTGKLDFKYYVLTLCNWSLELKLVKQTWCLLTSFLHYPLYFLAGLCHLPLWLPFFKLTCRQHCPLLRDKYKHFFTPSTGSLFCSAVVPEQTCRPHLNSYPPLFLCTSQDLICKLTFLNSLPSQAISHPMYEVRIPLL